MDVLAIVVGWILGVPAGIWIMHRQWNATKDLWNIPIEKREEWLIEKKADAAWNVFVIKFLVKGGLIALIGYCIYLWHKFL